MSNPAAGFLAQGSYEDAMAMVGAHSEVRFAEVEVNVAMVKYFSAVTEDANPSYWDTEFAQRTWGSPVAPPGMLQTWLIPIQWRPQGTETRSVLARLVPLPGETMINVSTDIEYFQPIRVGEHLNVSEVLVAVSPAKKTRIGTGHFVTTVGTYRNQTGEVLARNTSTLFRYRAGESDE